MTQRPPNLKRAGAARGEVAPHNMTDENDMSNTHDIVAKVGEWTDGLPAPPGKAFREHLYQSLFLVAVAVFVDAETGNGDDDG